MRAYGSGFKWGEHYAEEFRRHKRLRWGHRSVSKSSPADERVWKRREGKKEARDEHD